METLLIDTGTVKEYSPMTAVIKAVEDAFGAYERDDVIMPVKSYIDLERYNGDFRSMPAYVHTEEWDAVGVKWVNVHPDNPSKYDLPTVLGIMIYSDPATAFPLAIMDASELTRKRTGAAAAVATKYLAVDDATSLGIIGAGAQSYSQLEAIANVREIDTVVIVDQKEQRVEEFLNWAGERFNARAGTIPEAAACDVLSTITPVRDPIITRSMVGDHTHINAVGADAAGKQELDPEILLDAKLVIDDYDQCTHSGEINVSWAAGTITDDDIYGELGSIVTGNRPGREASDGITVFDSTGLAIQDIAAANVVYENAMETNSGQSIDLVLHQD